MLFFYQLLVALFLKKDDNLLALFFLLGLEFLDLDGTTQLLHIASVVHVFKVA